MNEDERGDAIRGIPELRLLVVLEFYLGVPWASPSLGSCHSLFHSPSNLYPKHENFTTQTQQKTHNLRQYKKIKPPLKYCCELILNSYWCNIYCIPTSLWFIPSDTTHRFIKISKQHMENRICQKHNSLQQSITNANFWNSKHPTKIGSPGKFVY